MVFIRSDAVHRQEIVHETLEGRLDPRIARVDEESRRLRVIGAGQAATGGQRLVAEIEHLRRPVVVAFDASPRRPQLLEHLLLVDPSPESVHLEVERDIRVKRVIPTGNRLMIS
jgi:hypothetical protein